MHMISSRPLSELVWLGLRLPSRPAGFRSHTRFFDQCAGGHHITLNRVVCPAFRRIFPRLTFSSSILELRRELRKPPASAEPLVESLARVKKQNGSSRGGCSGYRKWHVTWTNKNYNDRFSTLFCRPLDDPKYHFSNLPAPPSGHAISARHMKRQHLIGLHAWAAEREGSASAGLECGAHGASSTSWQERHDGPTDNREAYIGPSRRSLGTDSR